MSSDICKSFLFQFILHIRLFRVMPKQILGALVRVYILNFAGNPAGKSRFTTFREVNIKL